MNISRRWLEGFLRRPLEAPDLVRRLAMLGAPVDVVEPLHPGLEAIVIGYVDSVALHPNADRLRVCLVNDGQEGLRHVVCGAPNVTAGKKYPFARVGVTIPGGITLERRKIRGEVSEGMLCSARELGLGQDHDGILELDTEAAPGTPLLQVMPLADDRLVVDVTPNRPDLLGHKGVARELAWSFGTSFRLPEIPGAPVDSIGSLRRADGARGTVGGVTVGTEDVAGCPRFTAVAIRGVKIGPSPRWLAERLEAAGVRSISNVVDATNYVMLELNHPMHAYDLTRLRGPAVIVRRARNGETVTTLDATVRKLSADMTVIADAERVIGVAGVMGAENTEVSADTTDLLLECACFDPARTRRTRRALGLPTDASYRFERGVDLWGLPEAQRRCVAIILATAGGRVEDGLDVWPEPAHPARVFVRTARVAQVLGADLPVGSIETYLVALGCTVLHKPEDARLAVDVPGWRPDLVTEIDLIEEIARLHGYDSFPTDLRPYRVGRLGDQPLDRVITRVRDGMVAQGLFETATLSLGPADGPAALRLLNPLSTEEAWLRQELLPSLARAVETNWSKQERGVRLFEIGAGFAPGGRDGRPIESTRVAAVITGPRSPAHWSDGGLTPDFDQWDLKSLFETAVALANPGAAVHLDSSGWIARTPDGTVAGRARRLDLAPPAWAAPVYGLEIELSPIPAPAPRYVLLPTTPSSWRDLTLLLGPGVLVGEVGEVLRRAAGTLLESVEIVSEFRTDQLGPGRRAVQFRLTFRAPDRTVRDEEVESTVTRMLKAVERELDAKLRSS